MAANQQVRVLKAIAEQIGFESSYITPDKRFIADLGCDSLDSIEIVMALEDEFSVEIDDNDAEKCVSVQDAIDLIARLVPSEQS